MPKTSKYGVPDQESPEWSADDIKQAMRLSDLAPELQKILQPRKPRGPQKAPVKELISIRLSPDVLHALRARGRGWQAFADETLRKQLVKAR